MPPVIAPIGLLIGVVHVYVVPLGTIFPLPLVGVTEKAAPEQIAAGVTLAIAGLGFTLITTVKAVPVQLLKIGVIV